MHNFAFYLGGGLGDLIHHYTEGTLCRVLPLLKRQYPDCSILAYVYTNNDGLRLLNHSPYINRVYLLDKPQDESWRPTFGDYTWLPEFLAKCVVEDVSNTVLALPVGNTYIESVLPLVKSKQSVLIHPFTSNIAKICVEGSWWVNLIEKFLGKGITVHLVGSGSDWDNTSLISDLRDYVSENKNPLLLNHVNNVAFYEKLALLNIVDFSVVVDSCWMNAAQHFRTPSLLLQNSIFYKFYFERLESVSYDATWFPCIRNKLHPNYPDFFDVMWCDKYQALPDINTTFERIQLRL